MTDRPTPPQPDPADPSRPADETAALPQGDPVATAPLPPQAGTPQQPPPGDGVPQAHPAGGWQPGVPTASAAAPAGSGPGAPRGWWGEATSTGGGRAALIGVAVLAALFLVAGVGLTAALVFGHARDDGRMGFGSDDGRPGMGMGRDNGKGNNGNGRGNNGNGRGNSGNGNNGNGMMGDDDVLPPGGQANPALPGNGRANGMGMGRGGGVLGAGVLHGEFTTSVTGTPTVMVVQTGQVTAYTAGRSLTVRSSDGFEATYTLDATVAQAQGATTLANGVQVRVVAAKEGMKVTAVVVG